MSKLFCRQLCVVQSIFGHIVFQQYKTIDVDYGISELQNYKCSDFHVNKTVLKLYNQETKVHDGLFTLNATNSIIKNDVFCILVKGSSISYQKLMICKGVFYFVLLLFFFLKRKKNCRHIKTGSKSMISPFEHMKYSEQFIYN